MNKTKCTYCNGAGELRQITNDRLMECLHCNGFGYRIFDCNIERKVRTTDPDDLQYHHNPKSKSGNKSLI